MSKSATLLVFLLLISTTLFFSFISKSGHGFSKKMDFIFYDPFMKTRAAATGSDKIVIIDIDETSLSSVGQWPWPRYQTARLVKTVFDMQPKAVGLDIIFPESDRTSLKNIQAQFQTDFNLDISFTGVPPSMDDNDAYMARIFSETGIVGARYFYFDHYNKDGTGPSLPIQITDTSGLLTLHKAKGFLPNNSQLETSLEFTGFTNNQKDDDGIIRQTPLLIEFNGRIFTHLSFSTVLKAYGIKEAAVFKNIYGPYIKAGDFSIPITADGCFQMQFNGPAQGYQYISAVDILNNNCAVSDIQNKVVFIGSSAIGLFDLYHTVYDPQFPGVEIHAVISDSIINGQYIIKPVWSMNFISGVCIITGIMMAWLFYYSSGPAPIFIGTFAWMTILFVSSFLAYMQLSVFISPGLPFLLSFILFSVLSFIRFITARQASFLWFKKLATSQQMTVEILASLVETRDPETGQHIKRTQYYARALAEHLKKKGHFSDLLTDSYITSLFLSVSLHDIGKVGIPDNILLKPGKLTDEEFEIMKGHSALGRDTIEKAVQMTKGDNYLKMGASIAGTHHERWNGKGYPAGLSGNEIPLSGRIMAISDVYDALISRRCYKKPFPHEKSMEIIIQGRGTFFDPVIVDAFVAIEPEIQSIASRFKDEEDSIQRI